MVVRSISAGMSDEKKKVLAQRKASRPGWVARTFGRGRAVRWLHATLLP